MDSRELDRYADLITGFLKRALYVLFIMLLLSQVALHFPVIREWVTGVDRLEGISVSFVPVFLHLFP
ncbi:hypothetical protein EBB07_31790 [Paenibacillaceae bacterium]|nr:hypothetical protein EBB07_31790 [Paenibacillaceae bacterium]